MRCPSIAGLAGQLRAQTLANPFQELGWQRPARSPSGCAADLHLVVRERDGENVELSTVPKDAGRRRAPSRPRPRGARRANGRRQCRGLARHGQPYEPIASRFHRHSVWRTASGAEKSNRGSRPATPVAIHRSRRSRGRSEIPAPSVPTPACGATIVFLSQVRSCFLMTSRSCRPASSRRPDPSASVHPRTVDRRKGRLRLPAPTARRASVPGNASRRVGTPCPHADRFRTADRSPRATHGES